MVWRTLWGCATSIATTRLLKSVPYNLVFGGLKAQPVVKELPPVVTVSLKTPELLYTLYWPGLTATKTSPIAHVAASTGVWPIVQKMPAKTSNRIHPNRPRSNMN